ncbi:MAG: hypothetical protein K0Q55_210 [Verrucomicrobia bacterium]|jgi:hypothetical protein|nr:hypothetical protein [Verrucomicrobiota bacterium]
MTKALPLLLLLLLTGCASRSVDAQRFHQLTEKQGMGHLFYCGTKEGHHYFAEKYFLKPTKRYRTPAYNHPIFNTFPKTSDGSAWVPWLVDLSDSVHGLRGENELRLPLPTHSSLPAIYDDFWLNQTNWPSALTNGHLTYRFDVSFQESSGVYGSADSFAVGHASGKRYSTRYVLNPKHASTDAPHKPENWTQIFFGPNFEWLPDGRVRMKTYHHANGLTEYHYLDANSRPVFSNYIDYRSNTSIMLRYDVSGEVAMRSIGPDEENNPNHPFKGKEEYYIGNRKVTSEEFIKAFRQYRREDIVGNKKQ